MFKEDLEELLKAQQEKLVDDRKLDQAELEEILSTMNNLVATKDKIKSLQTYVTDYKAEILDYMKKNHINTLYSSKAKSTYKISDVSAIKKDLVLMVIAEFQNGDRDNLTYEDVAETTEREVFSIRGLGIEE